MVCSAAHNMHGTCMHHRCQCIWLGWKWFVTAHLVHKRLPGQVGHSLELVVEEELREHEQEPKGIHPTHEAVDGPGVPAAGNDRTSRDLSCPLVQFNTSGHDSGTDLLCVL